MIIAIAAMSKNHVIGKNGQIPWKIKGEQKRFKEITTNNIVIMGRKSYEEIGRPLPNRIMIIVSKTKEFNESTVCTVSSIDMALIKAEEIQKNYTKYGLKSCPDICIAGCGQIYEQTKDMWDKLYLTEVDIIIPEENDCTYFPNFDKAKYNFIEDFVLDANIPYKVVTYSR